MDFAAIIDGVESFAAYVGELASVIGHVGRVAPLHDYCAGLLASEGRRSVEPMAALTAPAEVSVQHRGGVALKTAPDIWMSSLHWGHC